MYVCVCVCVLFQKIEAEKDWVTHLVIEEPELNVTAYALIWYFMLSISNDEVDQDCRSRQ